MKTAQKTSKTTTSPVIQAARQPFFAAVSSIQLKMAVNKPGDKFELEADKMSDKVMRMPEPDNQEKKEEIRGTAGNVQLKGGDGAPSVRENIQSAIQNKTSGGQPLSGDIRGYMEQRFNADFGNVRIHSDEESAGLSNQLSARAFTYQSHIFFSRDQYRPGTSEGKRLLAHELTHTIQQGHSVHRSPQVSTTSTQPQIQRSAVGEILDWIADKADNIPGFRLLTIVIGVNPITMASVDRSAANILRALIELMPGGFFITLALDKHGVFNKVAAWVENKIMTLGIAGESIKKAFTEFTGSLGASDLAPWNWGDTWDRAKRIFYEPANRLISFAKGVVHDILKLVKDAILKPLAALAQGTRGYDLFRAVLGEDPITGEPVPHNAETLIGGFMKLIGQQDVWENIKKGNAVARAWAWFQGALSGLMGLVRAIPTKIVETLEGLTFKDIINIPGVYGKIVGAFASIAASFIGWGVKQVIGLLEILFSVVAPGVMPYIKKAQATFIYILKNPIAFAYNLVRAGIMGFEMFAGNILEHLKAALIKWIVGPLAEAGVYIPKSFSLVEIIKLVLSVLGLTWQNIRRKLVKIIPDPVLATLEKTSDILVTLVKEGPVAAWEQIKAELSELKDQFIAKITEMISVEVVKAAVIKLVSMLNPAGAVIQAIIAIYSTITFFIEKMQQIAAVAASFIDSISAIAAGQVTGAAKRVEQTLANTLTLVISFMAKIARLGSIPEKVVGIIQKVRRPIDKGMDKIVGWLWIKLKKMASSVKEGVMAHLQWWKKKVPIGGDSKSHTLQFEGSKDDPKLVVRSRPQTPEEFILDLTPSNKVKSKVSSITKEIDAIKRTLVKAQEKSSPDEAAIAAADNKLTQKFNELGKVLAEALEGSDEGSMNKPLPIDYPKRRAAAYPNIYTGPLTKHYIGQTWLKEAATTASENAAKKALLAHEPKLASEKGFQDWKGKVNVYRAAGGPDQEIYGGYVGLDPAFANLAPGKVLVYAEEAGTGGGGKINKMFKPYGFSAVKEKLDGDHVMERQLGGPDEIYNLWPLGYSENRSSGSLIYSMKVKFKNKDMTLKEARQKKPGKTLHLLIRSVKTQ